MDKPERETRDLINVESFSQLPFLRPSVKEKSASGAIRLFGKEFGTTATTTTTTTNNSTDDDRVNENNINGQDQGDQPNKDRTSSDNNNNNNNMDTTANRKFECHYCCRNFPTSQALGGHQNAHKRERQHAKRAHFQSSASMAHGGLHDDYSRMSYNRVGPAPTSALPVGYHSWDGTTSGTLYGATSTRLYGNYSNIAHHPINGNPLATWRLPTARDDPSAFSSRECGPVVPRHPPTNNGPFTAISGGLNSQSRLGYESKASMQDHVSLDLHL